MPRVDARKGRSRTAAQTPPPRRRRPAPRRLKLALWGGGIALVLAIVAGAGALAWSSGWLGRAAADLRSGVVAMTVDAGFSVQEVLVIGRRATDSTALLDAVGVVRGDPILAFDPDGARAAIVALPWVRNATVERRLPDTIVIRLEERRPMALWQHDGRVVVIDREGVALTDRGLGRFSGLPLIVGAGAPDHAPAFLALLDAEPVVAERVLAAVRVAGRHWQLRLDNGVAVRLPEDDVGAALRRLAHAERAEGVFDRDIVAIDLRFDDRMIIQASPLAAERRRLPEENT